ncbi:MAG: WD40 repeat domain-containing protein [Armatimonadota bacterium]
MFSKPGAEITFQDVMHAMDYEDSREGRDAGMLWGTVGHAEWVASTGPACLHAVAWSPSGREIACGSSDGTAIVWDAIRHRPRWEWHAHPEAVNDMRFDPRGVSLLMGSDDGTVSHWLLAGSEPMLPGAISSGSRAVNCLDVSPDGDRVAFGTVDGYVGVWDIIRGRELARANLGSEVTAIAYSPSGTRLACGDGAGNVSVLGVDAVDATAIPRTLIVRDGIPTLDCPSCWEAGSDDWPGVQIANPQLGSEIECPGPCGRRLWLNDHVAASYDASPAPLRETRVVFALLALASAYLIQAEDRLTEAGDDVSQHDGLDLGQVLLCVRSIVSLDTQAPDDQARLRTAVARLSNPDMRWATTQSVRECAAVLTALQHDLTGGSMRDSFALLHQVMGLQAIMESGPWLDPVFTGIRALPGEDTLHAVDARLAQCVRSMTSIAEEVECGQADLESMLGPISGFWNALQACAPTERGFGCV